MLREELNKFFKTDEGQKVLKTIIQNEKKRKKISKKESYKDYKRKKTPIVK